MKAYLNEHTALAQFANVPAVLQERRVAETQAAWEHQFGITFDGFGPGWLSCNICRSSREKVYAWLETANIAAVDLEPRDCEVLVGRDPFSMGLLHALTTDQNIRAACSGLEPHELFDTLHQLALKAIATPNKPISDFDEEVIVNRLKASGVEVPDGNRDFLEPPPEPEPSKQWDEEFGLTPSSPDADLFSVAENFPSLGGHLS